MQYGVLDMKPVSKGFFTYWSIFHNSMLLYTEMERLVCAQSSISHPPWTRKTPSQQPVTGPAAPLQHRASTAVGCAAHGRGTGGSDPAARVLVGAWPVPRKRWEPTACYWVATGRGRGGTGISSPFSLKPVQQRKTWVPPWGYLLLKGAKT